MTREQLIVAAVDKAMGRFVGVDSDKMDVTVRYRGGRMIAGEWQAAACYARVRATVETHSCVADDGVKGEPEQPKRMYRAVPIAKRDNGAVTVS